MFLLISCHVLDVCFTKSCQPSKCERWEWALLWREAGLHKNTSAVLVSIILGISNHFLQPSSRLAFNVAGYRTHSFDGV